MFKKTGLFRPITLFLLGTFLLLTSAIPLNESLSNDILKYTNKFRRSKGLSSLVMRNDLNTIARRHSEDMASGRSRFGHDGFSKREQQVKKVFGTGSLMAENVAYGATTGKEAFDLWKKSTGHRKNMLGDFRYIGIGTARNKRGIIYYTEIFVR